MKQSISTNDIHIRLSNDDKLKYKRLASEYGLTLSGFFRFSAANTLRSIEKKN